MLMHGGAEFDGAGQGGAGLHGHLFVVTGTSGIAD
jgi:hypothetical protein